MPGDKKQTDPKSAYLVFADVDTDIAVIRPTMVGPGLQLVGMVSDYRPTLQRLRKQNEAALVRIRRVVVAKVPIQIFEMSDGG